MKTDIKKGASIFGLAGFLLVQTSIGLMAQEQPDIGSSKTTPQTDGSRITCTVRKDNKVDCEKINPDGSSGGTTTITPKGPIQSPDPAS